MRAGQQDAATVTPGGILTASLALASITLPLEMVSCETPAAWASSARVFTSADFCLSVFPGAVPPCSRCFSFAFTRSSGSSFKTNSTRV